MLLVLQCEAELEGFAFWEEAAAMVWIVGVTEGRGRGSQAGHVGAHIREFVEEKISSLFPQPSPAPRSRSPSPLTMTAMCSSVRYPAISHTRSETAPRT